MYPFHPRHSTRRRVYPLSKSSTKPHERLYGRRHAEGNVQFVNILLAVIGQSPGGASSRTGEGERAALVPIKLTRTWFRGQPFNDCPCYDRDTIRAGHRWQGPAVVAGQDSTIVVPPNWDVVCDRFGNLLITRSGDAT